MPTWTLDNADALAAQYRYTFYQPSPAVIARLAPGDVVKLIFRFESSDPDAPGAERMWVIVDEVLPQGRFKGRLDNQPRHITDLQLGDPVAFEACHIVNTQLDDGEDNLADRYALRCFVTRRVLDDGAPVGYLYREDPDGEDDSGWRITANDEDQAYMDDADNLAYVSLGVVLNLDDSFVDLLHEAPGAAYARDPDTGAFVACDDEEGNEVNNGGAGAHGSARSD
ncbi:DUF2185 domain-containing protein [Acidovorax sp. 210-6]|uniref:immunity protein Imm33 domain-containing protein n=1 Tax=Acidovorax sp. 210-6 TaxID=2699468 RepID=UPI00138A1592|nr:DUF2185 domain-containing protein [Acidovorax sp. 210-6]NCU66893.1 DUF2185 domain-containing protein [Acidovorax sp. 210-6]